jgi:murein DD-endopeptidase MepM/ murein hydrolase activator NlpD
VDLRNDSRTVPPVRGARASILVVLIAFCAGALTDAWLLARASVTAGDTRGPSVVIPRSTTTVVAGATPDVLSPRERSSDPSGHDAALATLRSRVLRPPIAGADPRSWKGSFDERRGERRHRAVDILAPRGTPVLAVDDGRIARRTVTRGGGLSVYQADVSGRFVYSYLHLDRYGGFDEGDRVEAGQVIGYVGTTGNAPPDVPHLHFAISVLDEGDRPTGGTPLDPYLVFVRP